MPSYNGWTNYETWNVALWLGESGGFEDSEIAEYLQRAIDDDETDIRAAATGSLADYLQEMHDENRPTVTGVYADLLGAALQAVDWREIASHYVDEIPVYSAGCNMPGYLPDNVPALFLDVDSAREYIAEMIEQSDAENEEEETAQTAAAEEVRCGKGELGVTIGNYHYFVTEL